MTTATRVPAPVRVICRRYDLSLEELLSHLECDLEDIKDDTEDEIEHFLEANGFDLYPCPFYGHWH